MSSNVVAITQSNQFYIKIIHQTIVVLKMFTMYSLKYEHEYRLQCNAEGVQQCRLCMDASLGKYFYTKQTFFEMQFLLVWLNMVQQFREGMHICVRPPLSRNYCRDLQILLS